MKKILFFTFLLFTFSLSFGQTGWTTGEDVISSNGNGYWVSDADSVFFDDDTLYICGADTLEIYVNTGKTLGMVRLYGTATNKDTMGYASSVDSVYFYAAQHKGDGSTRNDSIPETFFPMDSCEQASGNTDAFDVYPLSNSTLDNQAAAFITIRIYGKTGTMNALWLKEERVNAYR